MFFISRFPRVLIYSISYSNPFPFSALSAQHRHTMFRESCSSVVAARNRKLLPLRKTTRYCTSSRDYCSSSAFPANSTFCPTEAEAPPTDGARHLASAHFSQGEVRQSSVASEIKLTKQFEDLFFLEKVSAHSYSTLTVLFFFLFAARPSSRIVHPVITFIFVHVFRNLLAVVDHFDATGSEREGRTAQVRTATSQSVRSDDCEI